MLRICWTRKKSKTGKTKGPLGNPIRNLCQWIWSTLLSLQVKRGYISLFPIRWLRTRGKFLKGCPISPYQFYWVCFSCHSVTSDTLRYHGLQHSRHPRPSPAFAQTHVHWVDDAIQPSHSMLSPSLPYFNLYQCQCLLKRVGSLHQVPKYWSFSLSIISPYNEYSQLISFGINWFDLLAVQGTLTCLFQHHR